ncbi:MAG: hypothetical protein U0931_13220 [Vulcanimicrobiota bacterium]
MMISRIGGSGVGMRTTASSAAKPKVNQAQYENYKGGTAPDRTPGRFSPIDNEKYQASSYEKAGGDSYQPGTPHHDGTAAGNGLIQRAGSGGTRPPGVLAPPTGGGGGGGNPNQSLMRLAEKILLGQVSGASPGQLAREKSRLASQVERLANKGFEPELNVRYVVGAVLGRDPFGR